MSWFRRANRNRRRDRRAVPDVRLRSRTPGGPLRRAASRILMFLVVAGALTAGFAALVVAARDHWLHRVEVFALRRLEIQTEGVLSRAEIRQLARVEEGQNLLAIDLPAVQANLLHHPRVAHAELRRELPDTLHIEVRERFPIARVPMIGGSYSNTVYLLDESGYVMFKSDPGTVSKEILEFEASLPVLIGVRLADFSVGGLASDPAVQASLRLLTAHADSALAGQAGILSIDVSRPGDLVVLTSQGSQITFSPRQDDPAFDLALRRWERIQDEGRRRQLVLRTLDLSVTNNIPLRWRETPAGQEPQPPEPVRPRRRPAPRNV